MFGTNPIRKIESRPAYDGKLALQALFWTIQGEGPFAGCPAVFVRLAGCHLACTFCDTEFESNIGNRVTVAEIANKCWELLRPIMAGYEGSPAHRFPFAFTPLVVLTGGEPMRQEVGELVQRLNILGIHVQIETAGNIWRESLTHGLMTRQVTLVVSPKTSHVDKRLAGYTHHWKYIVKAGEVSPEDGLPMGTTQPNGGGMPARPPQPFASTPPTIWVSPCDEHDEQKNEANRREVVHIALQYGYRISLQTHKTLGVE